MKVYTYTIKLYSRKESKHHYTPGYSMVIKGVTGNKNITEVRKFLKEKHEDKYMYCRSIKLQEVKNSNKVSWNCEGEWYEMYC